MNANCSRGSLPVLSAVPWKVEATGLKLKGLKAQKIIAQGKRSETSAALG